MPDATHALVPLSGKLPALSLTNEHYDVTKQWRDHNVPDVVNPLFLAQKGEHHFMSTELLSTSQRIPPPRRAPAAGVDCGGAHSAGLSGRASSGLSSAEDSSIQTGRNGGGIAATVASTLGEEGIKASTSGEEGINETTDDFAAPVTPLLPTMRPNQPSRSFSCSGNVVPSTLLPRNPRNLNHFPISDTSDSAYSAWLVKHSLPPFLGKPCSAVFTVGNGDVIFKGNFVNPATHSDSLVAGKATLRTPFCVLF